MGVDVEFKMVYLILKDLGVPFNAANLRLALFNRSNRVISSSLYFVSSYSSDWGARLRTNRSSNDLVLGGVGNSQISVIEFVTVTWYSIRSDTLSLGRALLA